MANSKVQLHPPAEKKTLWAWAVGTFFGAGLLQPGPGTYGSVAAVLLWYAAAHTLHPAPVTLAIGNNPGGAALSGTTTQAAVNGVATFANLSHNRQPR